MIINIDLNKLDLKDPVIRWIPVSKDMDYQTLYNECHRDARYFAWLTDSDCSDNIIVIEITRNDYEMVSDLNCDAGSETKMPDAEFISIEELIAKNIDITTLLT